MNYSSLSRQKKCGGKNSAYMPCGVDSNNFVICTCNKKDGLKSLKIVGDSTKFQFYVNESPCTLQTIKNGNVVVGTKCEPSIFLDQSSSQSYTFGDNDAIYSLMGGNSEQCLGINDNNGSVTLNNKYYDDMTKMYECPGNTSYLFNITMSDTEDIATVTMAQEANDQLW